MLSSIILIVAFIIIFITVLAVAKQARNLNPTVGDLVCIVGLYNPDNGWVKEMRGTTGMRGIVEEIDRGGYLVRLEDGNSWNYDKEDLIVL